MRSLLLKRTSTNFFKGCKMLIHAHKRKEPTTIDTGNAVIDFVLNDAGEVVADVEDEADIEVLLAIPEAFKAHGNITPVSNVPDAPKSYVLTNGVPEDDVDLAAMNEDQLKDFAKANGVKVHHTLAFFGAGIRQSGSARSAPFVIRSSCNCRSGGG